MNQDTVQLHEEEILEQIQNLQRKLLELRTKQPSSKESSSSNASTRATSKGVSETDGSLPSEPQTRLSIDSGVMSTRHHDNAHANLSNGTTNLGSKLIVIIPQLPFRIQRDITIDHDGTATSSVSILSTSRTENTQLPFISAIRQDNWFPDRPVVLVGWIGPSDLDVSEEEKCRQLMLEQYSCMPVFLGSELANMAFDGFVGDVLSPLFHYVPPSLRSIRGEQAFNLRDWSAYVAAQNKYAEAVVGVYEHSDLIWVYDIELMMLPSLLRKRIRDVTIGFYLSTPFPSSEIFRILPVRKDVLEGVLAADLIAFHSSDYVNHFQSASIRLLGCEVVHGGLVYNGRTVLLGTHPMGIDPTKILQGIDSPEVKLEIDDLESKFQGKKIFLAVDRLNYTKGVPNKLLAFESFLKTRPEWKEKAVLALIAVPSLKESDEYKQLRLKVQELVSRINGTFGTLDHSPIVFINQKLNFVDLCALYVRADVAVVTSLRDSISLISLEYITAQRDKHGVLILSEFAGSFHLAQSSVQVNPWNIEELADAFEEALRMSSHEREAKHQTAYQYVCTYTAQFWARSFVQDLEALDNQLVQERYAKPKMSTSATLLSVENDVKPFVAVPTGGTSTDSPASFSPSPSSSRLFLLDYEDVLCVPRSVPELVRPSHGISQCLLRLASDRQNKVFVMSGRSAQILESWFPDVRIGLIAEYGCKLRMPDETIWRSTVPDSIDKDMSWREAVLPMLQYTTDRCPGCYLEVKDHVISFYFMDSSPVYGSWHAKELKADLLETGADALPIEISSDHKKVEIRPAGISKVLAVQNIIALMPRKPSFLFAICGDEKMDEDLYAFLSSLTDKESLRPISSTIDTIGLPSRIGTSDPSTFAPNLTSAPSLASFASAVSISSMEKDVNVVTCCVSNKSGKSNSMRRLPNIESATEKIREISLLFSNQEFRTHRHHPSWMSG
mmetsp:Transcript_5679/g.10151  ORF Transcript_5679/g.10151 Transcript_5679/m.10151 type:complete len:953 (-) Transcript_5679:67-2925(-)